MLNSQSESKDQNNHQRTVARVNPVGLCFVEEIYSKQIYCFQFDKVDGYAGQTAKELGLRLGKVVDFTIDAQHLVRHVKLAA